MSYQHSSTLNDLVDLCTEKVFGQKDLNLPYIGLEHIAQGAPTLLGFAESSSSISTNSVFQTGDILFGKLRPNLRKSLQIQFSGYCSTDILVFRAKSDVLPEYAALIFQGEEVFNAAVKTAEGTKMPRTSWNKLKAFPINIPPLPEQSLIAQIIGTIDETIAHTESLINKLNLIKAGLLQDLLTCGLDENGELRDPIKNPNQFQNSPLGRIPKDWRIQLVGDVFEMQLGKMLSKASKTGRYAFPYLANRNVQWDKVDISELEWMDFTEGEREKFSLLPGDLLVCEGGEVGRTAIWYGEMQDCYFQKAIHRLRPKDPQLLSRYMLRFMRLAAGRGFLIRFTSQTSIAHLTREKLALLPVSLPPQGEQQMIVDVIDAYDSKIWEEEAYRNKLKLQKQGLMDDLLTGRIRVNSLEKVSA